GRWITSSPTGYGSGYGASTEVPWENTNAGRTVTSSPPLDSTNSEPPCSERLATRKWNSESRMRENRPSGLMRGGSEPVIGLVPFNPSTPAYSTPRSSPVGGIVWKKTRSVAIFAP
ncbi:MAG: hypothetical protein QOE70_2091, partial [Chthoniobacter sp.]|nr:hypothetical protein [Chthoniobacter sp.]